MTAAQIVSTSQLTPTQEKAAQAIAKHRKLSDAAKEAGISDRTLHRYKNDPAFQARVMDLMQAGVQEAKWTIARAVPDAATFLVDMMHFGNQRLLPRMKAALEILDRAGVVAVEKHEHTGANGEPIQVREVVIHLTKSLDDH